jgi:hypothetical protein
VVRFAGAGYLIALGVTHLWRTRPGSLEREVDGRSDRCVWRAGALTNLLNPKVAFIYTSLPPSLVSRTGASTCGPLLAPRSRSVGRDGYAHPEALEVVWGRIVALVVRDGAVTLADLRDDLETARKSPKRCRSYSTPRRWRFDSPTTAAYCARASIGC